MINKIKYVEEPGLEADDWELTAESLKFWTLIYLIVRIAMIE